MNITTHEIEPVILQEIEVDSLEELESIKYIDVPEQDCYGTSVYDIQFPAILTIWQTPNYYSIPFLNKPACFIKWTYDENGETYNDSFIPNCLLGK